MGSYVFIPLVCLALYLCVICVALTEGVKDPSLLTEDEVNKLRNEVAMLIHSGEMLTAINRLEELNRTYGTLAFDNVIPSFYGFYGVALYAAQKVDEAERVLELAVHHHPDEIRSWLNLGEIRVQTFQLKRSAEALLNAFERGERTALPRLLRTKTWNCDWQHYEVYTSDLERFVNICKTNATCFLDSTSGIEYTDLTGDVFRHYAKIGPYTSPPPQETWIPSHAWLSTKQQFLEKRNSRVKVGFVSSDFGVHPVSSLVRGLLQYIEKEHIELYCFSLKNDVSWWGLNVSAEVEHFHVLKVMNLIESATYISQFKIDVLIDLNGQTMYSGLPIFAYRPSPILLSYLGLPTTTGTPYIDYFLTDYVNTPPEHVDHFTEKLLMMPPCYIVNDYAQLQGDAMKLGWRGWSDGREKLPDGNPETNNGVTPTNQLGRHVLNINTSLYMNFMANSSLMLKLRTEYSGNKSARDKARGSAVLLPVNQTEFLLQADFVFATFSNSQKMDPLIFQSWMNTLHIFPNSVLLVVMYMAHQFWVPELFSLCRYYGIESHRIMPMVQAPWIDQFAVKSSLDLVLDTYVKNGHTSGQDALWTGLPMVSFTNMGFAPMRAAQSMAAAMEVGMHDINSKSVGVGQGERLGVALGAGFKDYEDIISGIMRHTKRGYVYKQKLGSARGNKGKGSRKASLGKNSAKDSITSKLKGITKVDEYHELLLKWRDELGDLRMTSDLFDTKLFSKRFTHIMQALVDSYYVNTYIQARMPGYTKKKYHIFASKSRVAQKEQLTVGYQQHDRGSVYFPSRLKAGHLAGSLTIDTDKYHKGCLLQQTWPELPPEIFDGRLLYLNIGGVRPAKDWLNVNLKGGTYVEDGIQIYRPMHNLFGFESNSVSAIYSSHSLEHATLGDGQVTDTLKEWYRVLRPGGIVMISVPDLPTICRLYLRKDLVPLDRLKLMTMMFGAQMDAFDYHHIGFNYELLSSLLHGAGFCNITRVASFNVDFRDVLTGEPFADTAELRFKGVRISLNVFAKVCHGDKKNAFMDDFGIHPTNAIPYEETEDST